MTGIHSVIDQLIVDKATQITGWMSHVELQVLAWLAKDANIIVEFGSYKGRSTRAFADNTDGFVIAVDPWDGKYKDKNGNDVNFIEPGAGLEFVRNLQPHIEEGKVRPFVGTSSEFWNIYHAKADLIFIDADHRYEEVRKDIITAMKMVTAGGIICGHDYGRVDWPGVKKAVDEIFKSVEVIDTLWIKRF